MVVMEGENDLLVYHFRISIVYEGKTGLKYHILTSQSSQLYKKLIIL